MVTRQLWSVVRTHPRMPRGYVGLVYGIKGAMAPLVGVAQSQRELEELYPEAFESASARCPACGGLNPGDVTHTRC